MKKSRLLVKEPSILVRPKSVTRTFRVDDDIDLAFKTLALREDASVNQLVTKALRRYIEWENLADKVGLAEFHEKSLELLFDSISDERARELGRDTGMNAWMDMVTFLLQGFNYTTILKMLELRGRYGRWFIFDKSSENGVDTIILKHRQGRRVTAFLSEAVKALLERANLKFELLEMEHQVLFRVHLNQKREPQRPSPILAESPLPEIRVNRPSPTRRSAELGEKPEPL